MSTESGIPDFRSAHGLYNRAQGKTYEEMLSIGFFSQPARCVLAVLQSGDALYPDAKPNAGHSALARLEAQGKLKAVLTQNIDGLHQAAGSQNVYELHGSVLRNSCLRCGKTYGLPAVLAQKGTPHCQCGGMLRPDIVFYGEMLDDTVMEAAIRAVIALRFAHRGRYIPDGVPGSGGCCNTAGQTRSWRCSTATPPPMTGTPIWWCGRISHRRWMER